MPAFPAGVQIKKDPVFQGGIFYCLSGGNSSLLRNQLNLQDKGHHMNKLISLPLMLALCLAPVGCAPSSPPVDEIAAGIANVTPLTVDYKHLVEEHAKSFLKDPDSAIFKHGQAPIKTYIQDPFKGTIYGYCGDVAINAKNSFGAYVGFKYYRYAINYNSIIYFEEQL